MDPSTLDRLDGAAFQVLLAEAGRHLGGFLDNIGAPWPLPLAPRPPAEAGPVRLDEGPTPGSVALGELFGTMLSDSIHTSGPAYLAYVPGGGLPEAAIGDLIALVLNRFGGFEAMAPGLVRMEWDLVRWLCTELGLPMPGAGGLLLSGGSMSNLVALHTARVDRLGEDFADGVIYSSDQVHHSVHKAARVLGFARRQLRTLPVDDRMRLQPGPLRAAITADRARGLRPAMIVASAGTTGTGAVDPLPEIADAATEEGLWLHIDGAYGGCFALTSRGRAALTGIDRADSITLDPHKGLGLPYGTGALLVRDLGALRRAHASEAAYMAFDPDALNFADWSPELSREVRGLRLWLPLRMHGIAAFRAHLEEKLALADLAFELIGQLPGVWLLPREPLSIVAFGLADDNRARRVLSRLNRRGNTHLSGTTVAGRFVIRLAVLSFRTHEAELRSVIRELAELLVAEP